MSKHQYIVKVQGEAAEFGPFLKFLSYSLTLSEEYPDAKIFNSKKDALNASVALRNAFPGECEIIENYGMEDERVVG